jgi:2-polyprenyl-3-methyl-5-hydroxy-6-metoxy-1,4-benzoquinol methylase
MKLPGIFSCRACAATSLKKKRNSKIFNELSSANYAITDSDYGVTGAIYKCDYCHLLQCPEMENVLGFYKELEDEEYEATRNERYIQAAKLVKVAVSYLEGKTANTGLKLLDVGSGSGILVEAATDAGLQATGIEPSAWLTAIGKSHKLNIVEGVLPNPNVGFDFDIISVIDVIEHVADPLELLITVSDLLRPGGICMVVTPDMGSVAAKILGFGWWHFRIAHISYFNRRNLTLLAARANLRACFFSRPSWYFSLEYLRKRLCIYLPSWLMPSSIGLLGKIIIPLNLRDSLLMICERKD